MSRDLLIMGVLNVTPDSFSDGGEFLELDNAVARGEQMARQGAQIIDIGGESTRPGAEPVDAESELARVLPVVEALRASTDAALSIDTTKFDVAEACVKAGAEIINDITAGRSDPRIAELAASSGAGLALMHMQGEPRTMQADPTYGNVVAEVLEFLLEREAWAIGQGVARDQIALDPGIGFGKTLDHNLELLRRLDRFVATGRPILVGPSRKSFLRHWFSRESGRERDLNSAEMDHATAGVVAACIAGGAAIVRVHEVEMMSTVVEAARAVR